MYIVLICYSQYLSVVNFAPATFKYGSLIQNACRSTGDVNDHNLIQYYYQNLAKTLPKPRLRHTSPSQHNAHSADLDC